MITSKSPRKVAMVALAAGREAFSDYSHRYSPKKFTRPQLFACLVLKEHQKKDYRGICSLLADASELRQVLGMKVVPHYTTLQKASRRLLKHQHVQRLLRITVRQVRSRRRRVPHAAVDSSGFDARHASRYFIWRRDNQKDKEAKRPRKRVSYKHYGKLMVIVCCTTHAILAAVASAGPTPDIDQLANIMGKLPEQVRIERMVADAGFDSASNHRLLRKDYGILSTIPPEHGRPPKDPSTLPKDKYRRLMKTRFNKRAYRHRAQVETVFSMMKRNLGSALRARTHQGRCRDMILRVLTHNIMLALIEVFYRAGHSRFLFFAGPTARI
jgi:Transposase DDE domain